MYMGYSEPGNVHTWDEGDQSIQMERVMEA
jgi:hypothetical protein